MFVTSKCWSPRIQIAEPILVQTECFHFQLLTFWCVSSLLCSLAVMTSWWLSWNSRTGFARQWLTWDYIWYILQLLHHISTPYMYTRSCLNVADTRPTSRRTPMAAYHVQVPAWNAQHAGDVVHETVQRVLIPEHSRVLVVQVPATKTGTYTFMKTLNCVEVMTMHATFTTVTCDGSARIVQFQDSLIEQYHHVPFRAIMIGFY